MSEIWDVEMGYVTTRRGARLHLVVAGGRSYCKSGSGVIIQSRKARGSDAPHTCKRCRAALRTRLVEVLNVRTRRFAPGRDLHGVSDNLMIISECEELIEGMTPTERADRDEMLDTIRRNLITAYEAEIAPKALRPTSTSSLESDDQLTLF